MLLSSGQSNHRVTSVCGADETGGKTATFARLCFHANFLRTHELNVNALGLRFDAQKHISIFMRTTFDLPDELMKRAKIAAVRRGSSLRDLVAEALRRLLAEQSAPKRTRMTEAPIKLPPGHTIPIRSNSEMAQMFDQEDVTHLNDVYRGR